MRVCYGKRCKADEFFRKLLQIPVLASLLPTGSQRDIHLPDLSPVRVGGSQLPLSLCCTWYWELHIPWDPGPTEVFGWEDYGGVLWLALSFNVFYIKLNYINRGILYAQFQAELSSCDETTHQGGGKKFHHAQHLGSVSTFGVVAYQARSAIRHHNILWMFLTAEKTSRLSLNNWVIETPKVGWSWDGRKIIYIHIHTHIYKENPYSWDTVLRVFVLKISRLFDVIPK